MVIVANVEKKIQKNRFKQNPKKIKLNFGEFGLVSKNEGRLELIQLSFLKKFIKTFIKKKKSNVDVIREKVWYFGRPNFLIQKKSKNSRMGKGKGMVERKIIRIRRGFVLFEFYGISFLKLKKFSKKINKFCNIKFSIFKKTSLFFPSWSKNKNYIYYHNKYLF